MKETTAQRFGFGKSFQSPAAAAAVLGAALLASGTTDDAETAWSPAAACLLPDVLPVAGTLLSYGGSRQLAAGGTVTHSGAIAADGQVTGSSFRVASGALETYSGSTRLQYQSSVFTFIDSGRLDIASGGVGQIRLGGTGASHAGIYNSGTTTRFRTADNSADGPISCGAITASGDITLAASQRLFCSNGSTTGNYLLSGATAVFTTNSVAQGGWNSGGMYARKLFIDYANADICLARASASNLGIYAADGSTPAAMTVGAITASGNTDFQTSTNSNNAFRVRNAAGTNIIRVDTTNRVFDAGGDAFAVRAWTGGTYLFNSGFLAVTNSSDASSATADTFLSRASAGVWRIGTTSTGTDAGIQCGAITASGTISGVAGSFITLGVSSGTSTFNQVQIAAGNSYFWNGRSQIASPSDGVVAFKNNAGSADAALTCGAITASGDITVASAQGLTSSNWTRVSGSNQPTRGIAIRDAQLNLASNVGIYWSSGLDPTTNGSGGALQMLSGVLTTSGGITASGTVNYSDGTIDARTSMNHALTLRATGAANAIRVLDSGGATKWSVDSTGSMTIGTLGYITFPHSTRLGDPNFVVIGGGTGIGLATSGSFFLATGGTAATFIVGTTGSVTASGAIQETPIQSALDPTTANIPTGKRQGWYNTALSEFRDWVNIGGTLLKSAAYT